MRPHCRALLTLKRRKCSTTTAPPCFALSRSPPHPSVHARARPDTYPTTWRQKHLEELGVGYQDGSLRSQSRPRCHAQRRSKGSYAPTPNITIRIVQYRSDLSACDLARFCTLHSTSTAWKRRCFATSAPARSWPWSLGPPMDQMVWKC